ncbi:hypothetical protein ACFWXA_32580 [Streptomyces atroolivaceus]|uniref:hypothetical protein n=1 Tax=Streptomyces atroolivaceus TaxID=66869 RepID=UPI003647F61A
MSRYRQATAVAAHPGDLDAPGRARPATDVTATAPVPERLLPKGAPGAEDVPDGISAEDHAAGLASSLANLAAYAER